MSVTFEHDDGTLTVDELTNGRRLLTVVPRRDNIYVLTNTWETAYPLDLVQTIFEAYGPRSTCHAIVREEDPSYVQRLLTNDLFAYFKPGDLDGKQILDFGCGSGASSLILGRTFPNAQITGVELVESSLTVARKTVDYYGLKNVMFCQSPSGTELPSGIDDFDFVIMSAVFEHLLPDERAPIMSALWRAVRPGGHLFINQTPNQLFPVELHTTMLPFINYVPDRVAHWMARRFSKRVARGDLGAPAPRRHPRGD